MKRLSICIGAILTGAVCVALQVRSACAQDPITGGHPIVASPNAWEMSLALEQSNDIAKAKGVLVEAFGPRPPSYDVCVRLAWLSLRLGDAKEAISLYRAAIKLPGTRPEAVQGLASALALQGYQALARGNYPVARDSWTEALHADRHNVDATSGMALIGPVNGVNADIWYAGLSSNIESSRAKALYFGVPARINSHVSMQAAYRNIGGATATTDTTGLFGSQHEVYGGIILEDGRFATSILGLAITNYYGTSGGAAVSTRFGGRTGATLTLSGIHQANGWNTQVVPQVYDWVTNSLILSAGIRQTGDPQFSGTSLLGEVGIHHGRLGLDVAAHSGESRLAFSAAGPTVLSMLTNTRSGGTVTLSGSLRPDVVLFLQAETETLGDHSSGQHYTGLATGIHLIAKTSDR